MENIVVHSVQQTSVTLQTDAPASSSPSFSHSITPAGFSHTWTTGVKDLTIQYIVDVVHCDEITQKVQSKYEG